MRKNDECFLYVHLCFLSYFNLQPSLSWPNIYRLTPFQPARLSSKQAREAPDIPRDPQDHVTRVSTQEITHTEIGVSVHMKRIDSLAHWAVRFVHLWYARNVCRSATGRCAVWVESLSVQRVITNNINCAARINRRGGGEHTWTCSRSGANATGAVMSWRGGVNCSDIMSVCLHNQREGRGVSNPSTCPG